MTSKRSSFRVFWLNHQEVGQNFANRFSTSFLIFLKSGAADLTEMQLLVTRSEHQMVEFSLFPRNLPNRIDIEPTIRCNLTCTMCQRSYWNRRAPDMSLGAFKHIYDSFPTLTEVKIQGIGEPLLNDSLFDMIRHAKAHGSYVSTYTNGSLLHISNNAERLLDSGIDLIRISIDGGTSNTYEMIRKGGSLDRVVTNVSLLARLSRHKTVRIELWCVAMTHNINELPQIIDLAQCMGISMVHLQMVLNTFDYRHDVGDTLKHLSLDECGDLSVHLQKAARYALERGVCLRFAKTKAHSSARKCHWPFDSMFVSVEGDIVPCCTIADPTIANMGNILETDLAEIWHGHRYRVFRSSILKDRILPMCRSCYSAGNAKIIASAPEE